MRRVKAQGFGASTNEEMDTMGKGDIKVLSDLLGEKEFMFGDEPSLLDLIVFSHLAPVSNPFITRVLVVDNPPPP